MNKNTFLNYVESSRNLSDYATLWNTGFKKDKNNDFKIKREGIKFVVYKKYTELADFYSFENAVDFLEKELAIDSE